ncbi:ParA family protein [Hydrogenophaga sp. RAC07]|uniref:ParA family protein n=1 Tax=Hydrogenophaga sp. RAC07 TaxID=1842537 RepID=UPI0009F3FCC2|nr:ParA family protein [Hydrogenophaga sp. RAC07]
MYTVTFYSFKGGVGRTMALVNVATQLIGEGKKVLIVDFDLEAPGLTSYNWTRSCSDSKGVVEYVTDYRATKQAPDVSNYICLTEKLDGGGELWTMPAGRHDAEYSTRLNSIDWRSLYEVEDGYLFFEDLKQQWQNTIAPDYVLIDSRTGHSDVEGICTRQLPEAVCLLFFPNEQNLLGMKKVSRAIETQNSARKNIKKPIALHYVASNVPDLDDEDEIVGSMLQRFQSELHYKSLAAKLQHYSSLLFLNQTIFSIARPKSRLAKEYKRLADTIVEENIAERTAAIGFLKKTLRKIRGANAGEALSEALPTAEEILQIHSKDDEVGYRVALIFEAIGRNSDALSLLTNSHGENKSAVFSLMARLNHKLGNKDSAIDNLHSLLASEGAELPALLEAMSYIDILDSTLLNSLPESPAFHSLNTSERLLVAQRLDQNTEKLNIQERILSDLDGENEEKAVIENQLAITKIGLGKFQEAKNILRKYIYPDSPDITAYFNLAMATWGIEGSPSRDLFGSVVQIHESQSRRNTSPNYSMCLGVAYGALGQVPESVEYLSNARELMLVRPKQEFSCWTYTKVPSTEFQQQLRVIEAVVKEHGELHPAYIERVQARSQLH